MSVKAHHALMLYAAKDPLFASVRALLHMEGTNNSTAFPDATGRSWAASGGAKITTSNPPPFGSSSGIFDGMGATNVNSADTTAFSVGTGDFCLEGFVRPTSFVSESGLINFRNETTSLFNHAVSIRPTSGNLAWTNGTTWLETSSGLVINTWQHFAVNRSAGTLSMYIGGVRLYNSANTTNITGTRKPRIGAFDGSAPHALIGQMKEVRCTNASRYTGASFTPPTTFFPNQ